MALGDITRQAVIAAITEYDELGQDQFLSKYGFERARSYVLVHDGKSYDSKAIVGAAHGFLPGQSPLRARQFSGGEATVGRLLRRLGFIVPVGDVSESAGRSPAEIAFASLAEKQRRRWHRSTRGSAGGPTSTGKAATTSGPQGPLLSQFDMRTRGGP